MPIDPWVFLAQLRNNSSWFSSFGSARRQRNESNVGFPEGYSRRDPPPPAPHPAGLVRSPRRIDLELDSADSQRRWLQTAGATRLVDGQSNRIRRAEWSTHPRGGICCVFRFAARLDRSIACEKLGKIAGPPRAANQACVVRTVQKIRRNCWSELLGVC